MVAMGSTSVVHGSTGGNWKLVCDNRGASFFGISTLPIIHNRVRGFDAFERKGKFIARNSYGKRKSSFQRRGDIEMKPRRTVLIVPRSGDSTGSNSSNETSDKEKTPFGYSRKDVLLIGVGVTLLGIGLKSGLEFVGVDPLQAGNVVQLVLVLGLTIGWISTYIFRVSNKEMTYAQQLRDYELKVMEKRLDGLTEAELQVLLEQVEEEKKRLASGEQVQ